MIEVQADYVLQALDAIAAHGPLSVRQEVSDAFNADLQKALAVTPWAGTCTSWYKTADGRILNNWPHTARAYARAVERFDLETYEVMRAVELA
nr:hypothetical protein JKL49_18715 [Phenylobacterium glaciei]